MLCVASKCDYVLQEMLKTKYVCILMVEGQFPVSTPELQRIMVSLHKKWSKGVELVCKHLQFQPTR